MKTKMIPTILMLLAGAVTSIICFIIKYEIKTMMFILLAVMFLFFFLGDILRFIWEKNVPVKEKEKDGEEAESEGSVIEKEANVDGNSPQGEEAKN